MFGGWLNNQRLKIAKSTYFKSVGPLNHGLLSFEIDGYQAVSAGHEDPWKTEAAADLMFELANVDLRKMLKRVPYQIQKCCLPNQSGCIKI